MNLHEYQAKELLNKYGIPISDFFVISSLDELKGYLKKHPMDQAVLKVQIHAGGRGKAGGIKFARSQNEIIPFAEDLLGKKIVNNQTGSAGLVVRQVMVTQPVDFIKENYLSVVLDRKQAQAVLIASPAGGMEIEQIAEERPEALLRLPIPQEGRLRTYQLLEINKFMGWKGDIAQQGNIIVNGIVKAFLETDALLIEINPLVQTKENKLIALDAKVVVDDNALFRQSQIKDFYDPTQFNPGEVQANKFDLAYVALNGNIGCMVNGAGLAMATMDIIKHYGGKPANFLDVGGGASQEKVTEGFKIILADPQVKAILVNIFGGIMNCETIAQGIIAAGKELHIHVPLIVRLEGTNVDLGRKLLKESKMKIETADSLDEAAKKAVNAAGERS